MPYNTPQEVEDAFYDAFEEANLDALMATWAKQEIVCIQPMAPILDNWDAIRESWQQIFATGIQIEILIQHRQWIEQGDIAIHSVQENLSFSGGNHPSSVVFATNIYRRSKQGWLLILHHTSPPPPPLEPV